MKFRHFCTDQFKKDCTKIKPSADIHKGTLSLCNIMCISSRGTSILGEVRNVEIPRTTKKLLNCKSHDFLAVFALAHSKTNQIAKYFNEIIQEVSD